jgi:hypothetical protein
MLQCLYSYVCHSHCAAEFVSRLTVICELALASLSTLIVLIIFTLILNVPDENLKILLHTLHSFFHKKYFFPQTNVHSVRTKHTHACAVDTSLS